MTRSFRIAGRPRSSMLRHVGGDVAQHHRRVAALVEHVDAEAAEARLRDREVDLEFLLEVARSAPGSSGRRRPGAPGPRVSTCLLTGMIWPSILILIGAFEVKNRSEALLLDHQLEQRRGVEHEVARRARPALESLSAVRSARPARLRRLVRCWRHGASRLLLVFEDLERTGLVEVRPCPCACSRA